MTKTNADAYDRIVWFFFYVRSAREGDDYCAVYSKYSMTIVLYILIISISTAQIGIRTSKSAVATPTNSITLVYLNNEVTGWSRGQK